MAETNVQVQNIIDFIRKTWPDIVITEARIAGWIDEINNGSGRGRSITQLREDIFEHVVGHDRVREHVRKEFEKRGIEIATEQETEDERLDRIMGELTSGERTFADLGESLDPFATIKDQGGGVTTENEVPEEEKKAEEGTGGKSDDTVSILTSKDMRWYFDTSSGKWYVSYKLPGSERHLFFEATGSQLDAIFGEGQRPAGYESIETLSDLTDREGFSFGGDITEVHGEGTFEADVEKVIALALDEGTLPEWAGNDPAVHDLLYIATTEGKSQEWLIEELSKLPSFKARFPNLDAIKATGLTTTEAVEGFLELEQGVKALVVRDGGDPTTVNPDTIGDLVAKGHSLTDVQHVFETFDIMEKNQGALDAFNEVLAARGIPPLDEEGMFEFMAGRAPKELYDIWEETSLNRAAKDAGLDIDVSGAIDLARRTEGLTSYGSALEGLSEAASNILRFRGEIGLEQFGLNQEDLVDLSLGLPPSSGMSQADIARNMERAFASAQAKRTRARVNPFKRFTTEGTPQQSSLSNVRQEG